MSVTRSSKTKTDERAFILECINVYRSLPALWNNKSKEYSNRQKKDAAYSVLVSKYRENYPQATREDVTKKLNSLRTNFRKELKRISDSDADEEPTLWYFQEMSFLHDQGIIRVSSSTTNELQKRGLEDNSLINVSQIKKEKENSVEKENVPIKRKKDNEQDELMVSPCMKGNEDEYDKIAKVWAVELQKISPEQQIYAKKAINDILFEGQLGTLHRNSVQINSSTTMSRTSSPIYCSQCTGELD